MFVKRVAKQLDTHGTLHVLRHGFKDVDAKFQLCQFRPAHRKNPELLDRYRQNRLTVIRQLHYSLHNENSIDLTLFVNGLPVATGEIKTDLTQNVKDAIKQYKHGPAAERPEDQGARAAAAVQDARAGSLRHVQRRGLHDDEAGRRRDPLPAFQHRPPGRRRLLSAGAGNPPAPNGKGYPTYYLWEWVWRPDIWLEILGEFMHLEVKEVESKAARRSPRSRSSSRATTSLMRCRQLSRQPPPRASGQNYLIQHSAGSGKSNTIAWTAHRLANLHDDERQEGLRHRDRHHRPHACWTSSCRTPSASSSTRPAWFRPSTTNSAAAGARR